MKTMIDLFGLEVSGATIEGMHRYNLWRVWEPEKSRVLFVMLNPSLADAETDDPTIRRCIDFAKRWGYGSLEVVNLFSFRATFPEDLFRAERPNDEKNDGYIRQAVERADFTVIAWGAHGNYLDRDKRVLPLLRDPHCLGLTQHGQPRHPLYITAAFPPAPYYDTLELNRKHGFIRE